MQNGPFRGFPLSAIVFVAATFVPGLPVEAGDGPNPSAANEEAPVVEKGSKVSIEYTLKVEGQTLESNVGDEPLTYEQGAGQVIPGLEEGMAGLKEGEEKILEIPPEKAYGAADPRAFQEIELAQVPEEARKEGAVLVAADGSGNRRQVRLHEIRDDKALIDLNHPLAGKTLQFDVKVVSVE